ncbi:16S rRNA (guanine(966)-N(2))-methyltransferase RsmD [Candidatus Pelagibacter sp.]|nr:16S rRNA (guanine(966)-N(2))-methyltransferase RsmD [Candidatus Pelagibacter sp.]
MRVISGSFKGKKIFEPKDNKTRPLKDLAKESIFNIIEHSNKFNAQIIDSNILDLFSGVGSFGIECLSRGSKKVVFIENYSGVLPILKKNLSSLKLVKNYEILEHDIYSDKVLSKLNNKFDIIFLDPPFKDKNINTFLLKLKNYKILNKNGVIIIHRHKDDNDDFSEKFKVVDEKKYGISKISFLTNLN